MSSAPGRGTVLFIVIAVVMGATVGLKLYGVGEDAVSASSSVHSTTTGGATPGTPGASGGSSTTTATPDDSSSASATPSPSASSSTTTVTGSAVDTRYGAVQVQVSFSGSTITAVTVLQSPDREGRDIEINDRALPVLEQEVLASQSANIDTVSGATYTSEGYIQSVQSVIDQR